MPATHTRRLVAAVCLVARTSSRRHGGALVLAAIALATTALPAGAARIHRLHKPTSLSVTATTSSLTLSWKAVRGAVAYDVYFDRRNPCWSLGGLRGEEKLFARAIAALLPRYGRAVFRRGHLAMNLTIALLVHQRAAIRYGGSPTGGSPRSKGAITATTCVPTCRQNQGYPFIRPGSGAHRRRRSSPKARIRL